MLIIKKTCILLVVIFGSACALSVSISGIVTDSLTQKPVPDAEVRLIEGVTVLAITNSTGQFTLSGNVTGARQRTAGLHEDKYIYSYVKNASLYLSGISNGTVFIDVFNVLGKQIAHRERKSEWGQLEFPDLWNATGVYYVNIKSTDYNQTLQCVSAVPGVLRNASSPVNSGPHLSKRTATYTIEVWKEGYAVKRVAIPAQSTSSVNIHLTLSAPVLYPSDRTYSPFDATIVQRMRDIASRGKGLRCAVFMKVGDSQSILSYQGWLHCFDGIYDTTRALSDGNVFYVKLCGRDSLKSTIDYFKSVMIDSTTSYGRSSLCTIVGTKASDPLAGVKPALLQEYAITMPQFALIMFGSNDIQGRLDPIGIEEYEAGLRGIADTLIRRGVIPVLSTMPERMDSDYENFVPAYNGVVRAICQGKQIPFYDVNRELWPLPYHGLAMPGDPVHIKTGGFNEGCYFCGNSTSDYLQIGINTRNLITMQMLKRIKAVNVDKTPELDPGAAKMTGAGTATSPFIAPELPFVDMRDNRTSASSSLDNYAGTGTPATAPGSEVLYKFTLQKQTPVRIVVCDAQKNAVSVHLMNGTVAGSCISNGNRHIGKNLMAGDYYVAVDGNTAIGGAVYTLSITACVSGDTGCAQ